MKRRFWLNLMFLGLGVCLVNPGWAADMIKIGFDIELTGDIPKVGEASKFTGEMLKEQINKNGGLKVGNKSYMLNFIYEDNEAKAESAAAAALKLITQDQVLGIVGPQASKQAIPAGEVADTNQMRPHQRLVHQSQDHCQSAVGFPRLLPRSFPGTGAGQVRHARS